MARSARSRTSRPKAAPGTAKARTRALRRPALSRPSRRRAGASTRTDEPTRALAFEAGDDRSGRGGDRRSFEEQQAQYPARRVREAGLTGGETPQRGRVTADDATPETLLDDAGTQNPADVRGPRPADSMLSVVDASAIGAGGGRDEAEDAQVDPISKEEHRRLTERVARSGTTLMEPNEGRAGSPGRRRNRRRVK